MINYNFLNEYITNILNKLLFIYKENSNNNSIVLDKNMRLNLLCKVMKENDLYLNVLETMVLYKNNIHAYNMLIEKDNLDFDLFFKECVEKYEWLFVKNKINVDNILISYLQEKKNE